MILVIDSVGMLRYLLEIHERIMSAGFRLVSEDRAELKNAL